MDGLTHSLLGLTAAKAGLERWSPYSAAVCVLSANAPDIDVVSGFFGDRWTVLQYHRGITHSIVGTLTLGILIPSIFWAMEWAIAKWRRRRPRIRYRGLLLASLIAAATHPLMDWTNNYGLRPLLPWNGRWVYGDLVFIVDPYIWLALGGAAFIFLNGVLLRTLHHWAGIPYQLDAMLRSDLAQASLSIFWTVLALAAMLWAHRRGLRVLWFSGAGLMAAVVVKLFLVDLAKVGGIERIVSFIAVGVLMLVIGYFAPLPPKKAEGA